MRPRTGGEHGTERPREAEPVEVGDRQEVRDTEMKWRLGRGFPSRPRDPATPSSGSPVASLLFVALRQELEGSSIE